MNCNIIAIGHCKMLIQTKNTIPQPLQYNSMHGPLGVNGCIWPPDCGCK